MDFYQRMTRLLLLNWRGLHSIHAQFNIPGRPEQLTTISSSSPTHGKEKSQKYNKSYPYSILIEGQLYQARNYI